MVPAGDAPRQVPNPTDGVGLRTLVVGGLPLLVAVLGSDERGASLRDALAGAGLGSLPGFVGHDLPKGARVGFTLDGNQLRLVDERDDDLLRAPREGLDDAWVDAARKLRGTMLVAVVGELDDPQLAPHELAAALEGHADRGELLGAVVGVVEERPNLPLVF